MKLFLTIIPLLLFLSCSKKAHLLTNTQTSSHLKESSDSSGRKKLLSIDRSVVVTDVDLDTLISVDSSPLSGTLSFTDSIRHFENNDLSIDFKKDAIGSNIIFNVSPKAKTINAKYHRKTTSQNNIIKTEDSESNTQTKINLQQDSVYKNVSDLREPTTTTSSIKSIVIWLIVLLIIAITGFVIVKRKTI